MNPFTGVDGVYLESIFVQKHNFITLFTDLDENGSYFLEKLFPSFPFNALQLLNLNS